MMFTIDGTEVKQRDLQNKQMWCTHGENKEDSFVNLYGKKLGLQINPEKNQNKYALDLIHSSGRKADLKTQNTPFFFAGILYRKDPQVTVTFNKNDAERYTRDYTDIDIYFWVQWIAVQYYKESNNEKYEDTNIQVQPMHGVWKVSFNDLSKIIDSSPLHVYKERKNDNNGNAQDSYLINLYDPLITRVL